MAARIKYPADYNPIREYWREIESGREVVDDKIRRTYQKLIYDLDNPGEWFYSPNRANHFLEFAENYCRHSKGKWGGMPVRLMLFQKAALSAAFGFIDIEGHRKYQEVILIVAKKNGKSLIASIVGLYLMMADGEPGAEVYAVATKRDQAKIIWLEARRMVRKAAALARRVRCLVAEMLYDDADAVFKPLASDSDTLDGLNVHGALMDEIHQWKNGKALYDIIADGITAREQPMIFITSTAGTIREDIYDQKYDEATRIINGYFDPDGYKDERILPLIYELDARTEWTNPAMWKKANPGLGVIKNERTLAEKVEKAKANPLLVKNLVCKEFNVRETSSEAWLSFDVLNNTATYDIAALKPRYGIAGFDLSSTTDLTCATVIFRVPDDPTIYVEQMYWIPADLLETRVREDKIPYDAWAERGLLRLCAGNKVNYHDVTAWLKEVQESQDIYIYKIGYDSWSAAYLVDELADAFGPAAIEPVVQGPKTFSGPMKGFAADLEAKRINYNNNPITKWCLANAAVQIDRNDNYALVKTRNPRKRIDGTAALLDAYIVLERNLEEYMSLI